MTALEPLGSQVVEDMIGFWVMWHLYGGFEGLEEFGMHKSTIWRKVARFRKMTGSTPRRVRDAGNHHRSQGLLGIGSQPRWGAP